MAIRSVATTDTLEGFRTTFNTLGTDVGDLTTLDTADKTTIVKALNEVRSQTSSIFIADESSTTTEIETGETFNISGGTNLTTAITGDQLDITLNTTITGLTSITSTTITDGTASINSGAVTGVTNITGSGTANFTTDVQVNSVSVATKPFAIAQAIALG